MTSEMDGFQSEWKIFYSPCRSAAVFFLPGIIALLLSTILVRPNNVHNIFHATVHIVRCDADFFGWLNSCKLLLRLVINTFCIRTFSCWFSLLSFDCEASIEMRIIAIPISASTIMDSEWQLSQYAWQTIDSSSFSSETIFNDQRFHVQRRLLINFIDQFWFMSWPRGRCKKSWNALWVFWSCLHSRNLYSKSICSKFISSYRPNGSLLWTNREFFRSEIDWQVNQFLSFLIADH